MGGLLVLKANTGQVVYRFSERIYGDQAPADQVTALATYAVIMGHQIAAVCNALPRMCTAGRVSIIDRRHLRELVLPGHTYHHAVTLLLPEWHQR